MPVCPTGVWGWDRGRRVSGMLGVLGFGGRQETFGIAPGSVALITFLFIWTVVQEALEARGTPAPEECTTGRRLLSRTCWSRPTRRDCASP